MTLSLVMIHKNYVVYDFFVFSVFGNTNLEKDTSCEKGQNACAKVMIFEQYISIGVLLVLFWKSNRPTSSIENWSGEWFSNYILVTPKNQSVTEYMRTNRTSAKSV